MLISYSQNIGLLMAFGSEWSLFGPIGGKGLHLILKTGWLVKIRSRVFPCVLGGLPSVLVLGLELYPRKFGLLDEGRTC